MSGCDLCGLPTPNPPIAGEGDDGTYCCQGCRQVAATVEDLENVTEDSTQDDLATQIPEDAASFYCVVDGMHCTTCEAYLRSRGQQVDGVYGVEANYGLESAKVWYDPTESSEEELEEALSGHGYTFRSRRETDAVGVRARRQRRSEERLLVGGFLTMLIMPWYFFYLYPLYVGFDAGLLDLGRTTTVGIFFPLVVIGVMTTIVLGFTGYPLLRGAWISLKTRRPNMDLLVTIAILSAYVYSVIALADGRTHLYFDVTVMVVMVVSLGRYYEGKLRSSAAESLSGLTKARSREAVRLNETGRETVAVSDLVPGDEVLVKPNERIPVDGHISQGRTEVDESILTGEQFPVVKATGDAVIGGSKVIDQTITVEVGPEAESTINRIATAMWDIQTDRPGVQRFADSLATVFVPLVLFLGVGVTLWRLFSGDGTADALLWGLTILLVSCPCAMGLATPLATSAGLRDALSQRIVVTNESLFEIAPSADTIVFDKTGTLTSGEMQVKEVHGHEDTLAMAARVERFADHPVADAIIAANASEDMRPDGGVTSPPARSDEPTQNQSFERVPGSGVKGTVEDTEIVVGKPAFLRHQFGTIPNQLDRLVSDIESTGKRPVVVGWNGRPQGVIGLADQDREWRTVVDGFADRTVAILTGDDSETIDRFHDIDSVDHVFRGVPPSGKTATITRFKREGTTVMIGDGTNDAPALATADLGIALGDGTADACDAADLVVLDNDLQRVEQVFRLARRTRRRIRENIVWALTYNAIALPLAIIGLINPFFAAVAMTLSSLIVVTNSRRTVL